MASLNLIPDSRGFVRFKDGLLIPHSDALLQICRDALSWRKFCRSQGHQYPKEEDALALELLTANTAQDGTEGDNQKTEPSTAVSAVTPLVSKTSFTFLCPSPPSRVEIPGVKSCSSWLSSSAPTSSTRAKSLPAPLLSTSFISTSRLATSSSPALAPAVLMSNSPVSPSVSASSIPSLDTPALLPSVSSITTSKTTLLGSNSKRLSRTHPRTARRSTKKSLVSASLSSQSSTMPLTMENVSRFSETVNGFSPIPTSCYSIHSAPHVTQAAIPSSATSLLSMSANTGFPMTPTATSADSGSSNILPRFASPMSSLTPLPSDAESEDGNSEILRVVDNAEEEPVEGGEAEVDNTDLDDVELEDEAELRPNVAEDGEADSDGDDGDDSDDEYHPVKHGKVSSGDISTGGKPVRKQQKTKRPPPERYGGDKRGGGPGRLRRLQDIGSYTDEDGRLQEPTKVMRDIIYSLGQVGTARGSSNVVDFVDGCTGSSGGPYKISQDSMEVALFQVAKASKNLSSATLSYIISCVNFAAASCRDSRPNSVKFSELHQKYQVTRSDRTLYAWYGLGVRYALLMLGGGVHIILLVLGLGLRARFESLFIADVNRLAAHLRSGDCGADTSCSNLITKTIIPYLLQLRTLCTVDVIGANGIDIIRDDGVISTKVCRTNTFNLTLLKRNGAWLRKVRVPDDALHLEAQFRDMVKEGDQVNPKIMKWIKDGLPTIAATDETKYIDLKIDLSDPNNAAPPPDLSPCKKGYKWNDAEAFTAREQENVRTQSVKPSNITDLRKTLETYGATKKGVRRKKYTRVKAGINAGSDLVFRTKTKEGGNKVAAVLLSPDAVKQDLKDRLPYTVLQRTEQLPEYRLASQNAIAYVKAKFKALRFAFFSRYSEKPKKRKRTRSGEESLKFPDLMAGNRTQRQPYPSTDLRIMYENMDDLTRDLADVYEKIQQKITQYYPDYAVELEESIDVLPGSENPVSTTFLGLVVNINAICTAHRDHGDKRFCVVIPFGKFRGGELVLYELGLVLELRNGDILFFESPSITHFNMPYTGFRGSLVYYTDNAVRHYVKDRNGWLPYLL